jgi:hypothetical protein
MHGTILVYGTDEMLVTTRGLILEKAGYTVFTARLFADAMLVLMNHQIDLCVLCHSLTGAERRGISETGHTLQPTTKCVVLDFDSRSLTPRVLRPAATLSRSSRSRARARPTRANSPTTENAPGKFQKHAQPLLWRGTNLKNNL